MKNYKFIAWAAEPLARWFVRYPKLFVFIWLMYLISPVDLIPEAFVGPLGYLDDLLVILLPIFMREYITKIKNES